MSYPREFSIEINNETNISPVYVHHFSFSVIIISMPGRPFQDPDEGWQDVTRRKR